MDIFRPIQHFLIVAPQLREIAFRMPLNFRKMLFSPNDSFKISLVYLFAKPIIPAYFLEYQERCRKKQEVRNAELVSGTTAKEHRRENYYPADGTPGRAAGQSRFRLHLLTLPTEIHLNILKFLDAKDQYTVGWTCSYFWSLVKPELGKYFAGYLGHWRGTPVACVGHETKDVDNYPPGLLTEEDKNELKKGQAVTSWLLNTGKRGKEDGKNQEFHYPVTLYDAARSRFFLRDFLINPSDDLQSLYWRYIDEHPLMPPEARAIAFPDFMSFFPTNKTWILRNLTTREFVVSNSIALKEEYIHGPFIQGLGFYEVILMRICWTTSPNLSIHNKRNIHQGKWAGHSLDIVPIDDLDNEDGSWKDISDEIAREIAEVWEENMGRDWREHVMVDIEVRWPTLSDMSGPHFST